MSLRAKTIHRYVAGAGIAAVASIIASPLAAQTTASSSMLEEIVVTARKREESLQQVPISVTALSGDELRLKGITKPDDLKFHTPGLEMRNASIQRNSVTYFIRGQGQTFGSSAGVVTYFADAPLGNGQRVSIGNNTQMYDLSSVQVLKGPQGTLFGRSSTGGAVLFDPQRPTDEFGGFISQTIGEYNWNETTAAVNIPLIEGMLNARLAGNMVSRDGFTRSLTTGQRLDDRDREHWRLGLEFKPTEWLNSYQMYARNDLDENNSSSILTDFNENNQTYNTTPMQGAGWFGIAAPPLPIPGLQNGGLCWNLNPGNPAGYQACSAQRLARLDELRNGLIAEEARFKAGGDDDKRRNVTGGRLRYEGQTEQLLNITTLDLGKLGFLGDVSLKNVFNTVRNLGVKTIYDSGSPLPNGLIYNNIGFANFTPTANEFADGHNDWLDDYSEEFQILGTIADKHTWILGYYKEQQKIDISHPPLFSAYADVFSPTLTPSIVGAAFSVDAKDQQTGIFGQATVDLSDWVLDGLKFTYGYRWTESKSERSSRPFDQAELAKGNLVPGPSSGDFAAPGLDDSAPSWTVGLDYQIDDDTLVYLAHRRGFKPGGTNVAPSTPVAGFTPTYSPETVDDVELGIKADMTVADMPLRANAAVYKMWYEDIQRSETFATAGGVPFTQVNNIAQAEIQGLELSLQLLATERLQLGLTYSYIDAKYTEWPGFVGNVITGQMMPYEDSPYVGTPENQGTITVRYTLPTPAEWGEMTLMGDYYRQSSVWLNDTALQDNGLGQQDGYGNLNLRFDWSGVLGEPFDIALFVKNATDDVHAVAWSGFYTVVGTAFAVYNEPRMFGAEFRYRFGDNK
ncbi:MAG TPA: TonB-dependent receptor [Porticoccaceae bacterium]|nr:TonB-dependent receptor [Porticoccaceae bacterium]